MAERVDYTVLENLLERAIQIGFFQFPDRVADDEALCVRGVTDFPTAIVTIDAGVGTKTVVDYHGCLSSSGSEGERLRQLRAFEAAIDSAAGSNRWVRPTHRAAVLPSHLPAQSNPTAPHRTADDGFWKTATPEDDPELNATALALHESLCQRTKADACLVVHRGRIVQEWYSKLYSTPMYAMSSTKSVAGLLTGMLIDDGRIKGTEEPVCDFLPTWCSGLRAKVTVRHLLSMTSGLPMMRDSSVGFVRNKNAYVLSLIPTSEPGTTWDYSNEGAQLLSPLLDHAAGEPIQDYARRRLFEPLGMTSTRLRVYPHNAWTYADMETTARDFARLGILMLSQGAWNNRQIVSREWVARTTRPSQTLNERYGLLWWIDPEIKGYAAHGHLDTSLHVIPDLDLVIVRMQSKSVTGTREGEYEREGLTLFRTLVTKRN